MRIQMCDACKGVYKPYARIEDGEKVYEGNGFSTLVIDRDGKKRPTYTGDLCPTCQIKLRRFLAEELGIDTSKKVKTPDEDVSVSSGSVEDA